MSQRNPMNERYTSDKHSGKTRRSSASAKPKTKAAASVTYGSAKKTPKDRKAEQKAKRKEDAARQRELDRKYYKPDTDRYRKLRKIWWIALGGAVVCTALSWFLRGVEPAWIAMACLIAAYGLIIFAFYIDFSKIRKERRAYQTRMLALEIEQKKAAEQEAKLAAQKARAASKKKGGQKKGAAKASSAHSEDEQENAEGVQATEAEDDNGKTTTGEPKKRFGFFARKAAAQGETETAEAAQ